MMARNQQCFNMKRISVEHVPVDHPDRYKQRSYLNTAIRHMTHAKLTGWPMAPKRYSGMMNELFKGVRWVDSCESWTEKRAP
jgi:hypothetical protein